MEERREEFGNLYDQYIGKIYRFVYLKVSSVEVAEDLCSDVFLRVWNEFSSPESHIDNMQAFLFRAARNAVVDHYRNQGRADVISLDYSGEVIGEEQEVLEERVIAALEMDKVWKLLSKLNDDHQNYIIWRYIDELSSAEVAQITGKSEQNVRVITHRALQALRDEAQRDILLAEKVPA